MKSRLLKLLLVGALALLPFSLPIERAHAVASLQTTHAWLCAPEPSVGAPGPRRVINNSTATIVAYTLNGAGCGLIASADIGFFLSQGYTYGPNIFTLQQTAIGLVGSGTTSTSSSITLPAYGYIMAIILEETAGNAVTGGVSIGDATAAGTFATGIALAANANVTLRDASLTRIAGSTGVSVSDQMLVTCVSLCNGSSINITILYSYF